MVISNTLSGRKFLSKYVLDPHQTSRRKRGKIFSATLASSFCFHLFTLMRLRMKTHNTFWYVYTKTTKTIDAALCSVFFVTVLKSLRFHLSTLETDRFQNAFLSKPFLKASVFISGRLVCGLQAKPHKKVCVFNPKLISVVGGPKMVYYLTDSRSTRRLFLSFTLPHQTEIQW